MVEKTKVCCICSKQFTEYGNDPWPVKDEGQCCNACNWNIVLPQRIKNLKNKK